MEEIHKLVDVYPIIYSVSYEQCSLNPSLIPWNARVGLERDSPFFDYYNPQNIKGSIIPQLIINQQGFSSHCSYSYHYQFVQDFFHPQYSTFSQFGEIV